MIIKRETYNETDGWKETKQESAIENAKTLAQNERLHICFHDEKVVRPCKLAIK